MKHYLNILCLSIMMAAWPFGADASEFLQRADVQAFIEEMHDRHGFDRNRLVRLFGQIRAQPKALDAIRPPKDPSARSWKSYRSRFVAPVRIEGGLRFWEANRTRLETAGHLYGVPEEIIVAIIGVETLYGRNMGTFPALATLATLAFDYPPRADLFRKELESLLLLARETRRHPLAFTGSHAGAMGLPQFLPSSVRAWGIDLDENGRVDLSVSAADAIGSVAHFLAGHGWEPGGPIAVPTSVTGDRFGELIDAGIVPRLTPAEMAVYGVGSSAESPQLPCALIDLPTPNETTEYWLGFRNFYVLTRYNRSSFYAMAVVALSRELATERKARLTLK